MDGPFVRTANVHSNVSNRPVGKRFALPSAGFRRLTAFEDADPHWRRKAIHLPLGALEKIKIIPNGEVFGNWPSIGGSGGTSPSRKCPFAGRCAGRDECATRAGPAAILERQSPTDESWMNLVRDFRRKFRRAAGRPESMQKEAEKHGCRKMYGIGHSRAIFDKPPQSSA